MKSALAFVCTFLLSACDQKPQPASSNLTKTETISLMAGSPSENATLVEATEASMIEAAGKQLVAAKYECSQVKHLWLVNFTGKLDTKILKVECTEGEYQLTLFDNKAFSKPWTGDLLGN